MAAGFGVFPNTSGWCFHSHRRLSRTSLISFLGLDPDYSDKLLWKDILFSNNQYQACSMTVTSDIAAVGSIDRGGASELTTTSDLAVVGNVNRGGIVSLSATPDFAVVLNGTRGGVVSAIITSDISVVGNDIRSGISTFTVTSEMGSVGNIDRNALVELITLVEISATSSYIGHPPLTAPVAFVVGFSTFRSV